MNAEHFHDLERHSEAELQQAELNITSQQAKAIIQAKLNALTEENKVLLLTNEEERMVRQFRRFKLNLRKDGEVFKWQTARDSGVVIAEDTALIHDPQEVSA